MARSGDESLARYLSGGVHQQRLLAKMAAGHAFQKHGKELGGPTPAAFRSRVRAHLANANVGAAVRDGKGNTRYLVATENAVAWIAPHKEHRSTYFEPRGGSARYLGAAWQAAPPGSFRTVDLAGARAAASGALSRGIQSASRGHGHSRGHGGPARD